MTEDEPTPTRRRFGPVRLAALAIGLVLLIALLVVWFQRKPIATGYIDRYFARAHVLIRYRIADLNLGRQQLRDVVIGDPAHPDLVADWLESDTRIGFDGAKVLGVRGGHVRIRGRLVDGRVSLGTIDRLLPPPSNTPFALPAIDLDVADLRLRLDTSAGLVGIKLTGRGRLDGGFAGEAAAVAPLLTLAGCSATGTTAALHVETDRGRPSLSGPVRAAALTCGTTRVADARVVLDATLGKALDTWRGRAGVAIGSAAMPPGGVQGVTGEVTFAGDAKATTGTADLRSGAFASAPARGSALSLAGRYRLGGAPTFAGRVGATDMVLTPAVLTKLNGLGAATAGTPVGPLARALSGSLVAAGRDFAIDGDVQVEKDGAAIRRALAISSSGVKASLDGTARYLWGPARISIDGAVAIDGGGLPTTRIVLNQAASGMATIAPYEAGGARLALTPVRFSTANGGARIVTRATLSGPLGNGRVEGASVAIDARVARDGAIVVDPGCSDAGFDRLRISGLDLRPARFRLCPIGTALVRLANGAVSGGMRIAAPHLAGSIGSTPLTLAADNAELRLGDRGFTLGNLAARLGTADRVTRLDIGRLEGQVAGRTLAGRFTGAGGQIGNVPLILSQAAGDWRLANGKLTLGGGLTVADAAPQPRFNPLAAHDVTLTLAGSRIDAAGTLVTPKQGVKVADVTIAHDLSRGEGDAALFIPGITFGKDFAPEALTPLTYGVIADVKGTVNGHGQITWNGKGVSSSGVFGTPGIDLAAAFGPVTGIKTELHFTDLLGMRTAPGQVATIASVNPGVAVENGAIRYRLLSPTEVQVEGGHWPFAGGNLALDPTLLDFGQAKVRRMTFRVAGMDAAQFLQQFDFKNLNATGTFDGVLPMTFDADGGRIVAGNLTVRDGGGGIAYVGDLTEKDLGFWGNLAFQALKSLRYRSLNIVMNGPLSGEMVTEVRFAGVSQGEGAKSNFLVRRLTKLPFVFNVTIRAPFRGLIDTAQSFYDPKRLIERNLPALLQQQQGTPPATVQPPASEKMP